MTLFCIGLGGLFLHNPYIHDILFKGNSWHQVRECLLVGEDKIVWSVLIGANFFTEPKGGHNCFKRPKRILTPVGNIFFRDPGGSFFSFVLVFFLRRLT